MRLAILTIPILSMNALAADYLIGEIKPLSEVNVMTQVDALVQDYHVDFGEVVTQGQTLVEFDDTDSRLGVALAQANLDLADVDYDLKNRQLERLKHLNNKKTVADSALEEQLRLVKIGKSQLSIEQQSLAIAKRYHSKHLIKAPFSASVIERYVEVGQWVNLGDPLYRIADISRVLVHANLVENDIATLKVGQKVEVYVPAVDRNIKSEVVRIADAPNSKSNGYVVELVLRNDDRKLKPGYRAEITVIGDTE